MKIFEATAKQICSSTYQFYIPIYQRDYSWDKEDCLKLLENILNSIKNPNRNSHFMGSICYQKAKNKLILVDGQQRLTTLLLFLLAVRDLSSSFAFREMITNEYLTSEHNNAKIILKPKNTKIFEKLLYQEDGIFALSNVSPDDEQTLLYKNYDFLYNKIYEFLSKTRDFNLYNFVESLKYLKFAVIELESENPQAIFENLNTTGKRLSELDKIKNYTLMSLPISKHEEIYEKYWEKLERDVGEDIEDFITSYLVIQNKSDIVATINESISIKNLYKVFKELYWNKDSTSILNDLKEFSKYYKMLKEGDNPALNVIFNILQVKSAMTFCMYLLQKEDEFKESLDEVFEIYLSYIIRSKVCERTNIKNSHAGYLINMTQNAKDKDSFIFLLYSAFIQSSGIYKFPSNKEFKEALINNDIYLSLGSLGTKYLLYEIEKAEMINMYELPVFEEGTVEHIMPQTLSQEWEYLLKKDKYCYAQNINTLGNLAITRFNSELSNKPFEDKCRIYKTEPYYYTREIATNAEWISKNIKKRAERLANIAIYIWKDNVRETADLNEIKYDINSKISVFAGQKPEKVFLLGEEREVKSWNDLCFFVYLTLYEFDTITMLKYLKNDKNGLLWNTPKNTGSRKIAEDVYLEMNVGAIKILSNIKYLLDFYDKESEFMVSDTFYFLIKNKG